MNPIERALARRNELRARLDELRTELSSDDLTAERLAEIDPEITTARRQIELLDTEIESLRAEEAQRQADADQTRAQNPTNTDQRDAAIDGSGPVRIRREPRTYERHDVSRSYFRDLAMFRHSGDQQAAERLNAHLAEMRVEIPAFEQRVLRRVEEVIEAEARGSTVVPIDYESSAESRLRASMGFDLRAISTTDGAGGEFVPPLWMIEEFISYARAGRVSANLVRSLPLPPGTDTIKLPKVTGGSSVASQATENSTISNTDITSNSVSGDVVTVAGAQDVSLQLVEQSPVAFDEIILADLMAAHAAEINTQVLNGSGSSGQMKGILNVSGFNTVTYTDTTPTIPELWPKIGDAAAQVAANRYMPATHAILHSTRWYWMASQLDSSNRPFITTTGNGPDNAMALLEGATQGRVSNLMGLEAYSDALVPNNLGTGTNEDRIIACRPREMYLFEGAVRTRVLFETKGDQLTVVFQLYSYDAFIADRRANAISVIAGTGLTTPSF